MNKLWECSNVIDCLLAYTWRKINLNEHHYEETPACLLQWNAMVIMHRSVWFVVNGITHQGAVLAANKQQLHLQCERCKRIAALYVNVTHP